MRKIGYTPILHRPLIQRVYDPITQLHLTLMVWYGKIIDSYLMLV